MENIHEKIAEGVKEIAIHCQNELKVPIGIDGAVISYLVDLYSVKKFGRNYLDSLPNTVCISSKREESDTEKFVSILKSSQGRTVCAIDMRTQSGKTGKMLRELAKGIVPKSKLKYIVLFDPNSHADLGVYWEPLTDDRRIQWLDEDTYKTLFVNTETGWQYNLSSELIDSLDDVKEIKKYL